MRRLCVWVLERTLAPEWHDEVIGDIEEGASRGNVWLLRHTLSAMLFLRGTPSQRGDHMIAGFLGDMRHGARQLRRAPAFAITAALTLTVAIGATAAILSVIEPVLLRPLPYPAPDRLAFVWERARDGGRDNLGFMTITDVGAQASSLERWAAIGSWEPTLDGDEPERVAGDRVSWSYFRTLGVRPMLGRDFLEEEDRPDHNKVVMLSYGLWQRRFGGDSSLVGRTISIGGTPMVVAGVMPPTFDNVVTPRAVIWRVLGYSATQPWACRTCRHLRMVARIKPSVSMQSAGTEIDRVFARIIAASPKEYGSAGGLLNGVQAEMTRATRPALAALTGAVLLVLLIAIVNVVNLQLSRSVRRDSEFAVRAALGAGDARITRQLLAEGLVLALVGGVGGLVFAWIALPTLVAQLPPDLPRLSAIHLDAAVVGATTAIVIGLSLVMAVMPRRRTRELGASLRSGRRLTTAGVRVTRSALVISEVALAALLLASAALVGKSLIRLLAVDPGFDATHLLSLEVDAVGPRYRDDASVYAYHDRIREAVAALPGVTSVAIASQLPLAGNVDRYGVVDADNPPDNPELAPYGDRYVVSADYLATMRVPLVAGRWFTSAEAADTANRIAVVSVSMARKLWGGASALGKRVRLGGPTAPPRTVVGVVSDVKHTGLDAVQSQQVYVPERQWFTADNGAAIVIRTANDPSSAAQTVRRTIASIDPGLPITRVATMDQLISATTAQRRLALVLFGAFAAAALLLAVAGIYGVLAGNVAERTREIGLRSALGATPREIMRLVLGQGARLGLIGLVLGLAACAVLTRYLRTFLFDVAPNDPAAIATVIMTLVAVTVAASVIPARRAVRVDPVEALRAE